MYQYFIFTFSLLIHFDGASLTWHTSQHALTQLYNLQIEHFDVLTEYLNLEEKRLENIKSNIAEIYKRHNNINYSDSHNHINYMKLMTHMFDQLLKLENLIRSYASTEVLKKVNENKEISGDQILYAYKAMRRLQKFYMIRASDMAEGRRNDRIVGDPMDACECYTISKYCFKDQDMYCVIEWTIETFKKWKIFDQPKCVDVEKLTFYIISSSVYTGFDYTTVLNPNEVQTSDDSEKFKHFFLMRRKDMSLLDSGNVVNTFGTYDEYYWRYLWTEKRFRKLCQYNTPVRKLTKYSKCRYQTRNSSYRLLIPFKEEDVSYDPYVKIYHDVLYENEILNFKNLASEIMVTAEVWKEKGSVLDEDHYSGQISRIIYHDALKAFDGRIEAFTGYSTKKAEKYQIVNYGLGGHLGPHLDAYEEKIFEETSIMAFSWLVMKLDEIGFLLVLIQGENHISVCNTPTYKTYIYNSSVLSLLTFK